MFYFYKVNVFHTRKYSPPVSDVRHKTFAQIS